MFKLNKNKIFESDSNNKANKMVKNLFKFKKFNHIIKLFRFCQQSI